MIIEYFAGFIQPFLQALEISRTSAKDKSAAISALRDALRHTKKHIADNRFGLYGDTESHELSSKWARAAELIRPYDEIFANSLESKSDYWIEPYGFKQEIQNGARREDDRMRLDNVEVMIRQFELNL